MQKEEAIKEWAVEQAVQLAASGKLALLIPNSPRNYITIEGIILAAQELVDFVTGKKSTPNMPPRGE